MELNPEESSFSKTEPGRDSLLSNMLWSMVSKAAEISRMQKQETCW